MKKYFTKSTIVISLIFLAIGFAAGFLIGKNQKPSFFNKETMSKNFQNRGNNQHNGNFQQTSNLKQTMGEITKTDDTSITIKTPDGGSKIILISDSTTFNKATTGTKTDLIVGANVSITGDNNSDGSITGKNININSDIKK